MSKTILNQVVTTSKRLPWIPKYIVSLFRKKVSFYHQAVYSNFTRGWAKYKHARNSVVDAFRSAKSDFLLTFSASLTIPQNVWSLYRSTSGHRQHEPDTLNFNDQQANNDSTKTNSFFLF